MDQDMKHELNEIKQAIVGLTQQITGMADRIDRRFDAVEKDLATTKTVLGHMATKLDIDRLEKRLDGFTANSALHAETLLQHDNRLRALEGRA